jgi:hypothetical protein
MARRQLFLGCIRPRGSSQVPEGGVIERVDPGYSAVMVWRHQQCQGQIWAHPLWWSLRVRLRTGSTPMRDQGNQRVLLRALK